MEGLNSNEFLVKEKLSVLMRKFSVPCIISLLVAALYNIVDQIFIANASYLGSYGNAANTVVFPLTVIALAVAVMIGDGCCAFVSLSLGAGNKENAHRSIGNSVVLCIVSSVAITAIYFILQNQILTAFGGRVNEETFVQSKEYFTYITIGIPFYMFGQAMNPIIRSDGSFIFVFKWGMMGAAVATVLGQVVTAILSIWYLFHLKAVKLEKSSFKLNGAIIKRFIPLGICSFLSQISLVAAMAAINNMIRKYGAMDEIFGQSQYAQIPMAVVGIVMKFFQIVISIVVGMAAGCIPIVGYNIGAGRKDRAKHLFTYLLVCETIVGVVAFLIVELLPRQLIQIFGVGFALLLPCFFGLDGVLYSMPVSDLLTFIVSVVAIIYTYRSLSKKTEQDDSKAKCTKNEGVVM